MAAAGASAAFTAAAVVLLVSAAAIACSSGTLLPTPVTHTAYVDPETSVSVIDAGSTLRRVASVLSSTLS